MTEPMLPGVTRTDIAAALRTLGLAAGDAVVVHSSLKSLGRVEGGPGAVIDAVLDVVGPNGTAVFPTFTGRNVKDFRDSLDDLVYTGIIPKTARKRADFVRSFHPLYSICAKGPMAEELCAFNNRFIFPAAEHKFLHLMAVRGGKALLIGCDHDSNSSVHLIEEFGNLEYKVQDKPFWTLTVEEFLRLPPERQKELRDLHNGNNLPYRTEARFNAVEPPLVKAGALRIGRVGAAVLRLMKIADIERIGLEEARRDPWFLRVKLDKGSARTGSREHPAMNCLTKIATHLEKLTSALPDPERPMWASALDIRTGRYPEGDSVPRRVYRLIGAPRGSTLYWDQPTVVAAYALSTLTDDPRYARSADAYVSSFLDLCVGPTGMFRWGNHAYYDTASRGVVEFYHGHHELRPITPAWEVFWRHAPEQTARYIRAMGLRHVYDPGSGGFNRHDDGKRGHAFIEAGGILVESLAWLYGKTGERDLADLALRVARYSYRHRGAATGLVANEPDMGRWDSKVSTSEIGLWAQCLLRAGRYASEAEFTRMAADGVRAYVEHAYDEATERYFGQVAVDSGDPVLSDEIGYWPRRHADAWTTDQWPTHDYPMALAEACLSLHELTGEDLFVRAVRRMCRITVETSPGRTGRWAYAESYGRCIHLLVRAGLALEDPDILAAASGLAGEAVDRLWEDGLFQGYPGSHLYESVDGTGYLLLALMLLDTRREPDLQGFGF